MYTSLSLVIFEFYLNIRLKKLLVWKTRYQLSESNTSHFMYIVVLKPSHKILLELDGLSFSHLTLTIIHPSHVSPSFKYSQTKFRACYSAFERLREDQPSKIQNKTSQQEKGLSLKYFKSCSLYSKLCHIQKKKMYFTGQIFISGREMSLNNVKNLLYQLIQPRGN